MGGFSRHSSFRRALLKMGPAALGARLLPAWQGAHSGGGPPNLDQGLTSPDETRLPNGKLQRDAILKSDYDQNVKDALDLIELTKAFELDLEKSDANVLSLGLLKKLDDIEKITKRIRGRMRH